MKTIEQEKLSCPNVKNHTSAPEGYLYFFDWAAKKAKTHNQTKCTECGYYVIWTKK